MTRAILPPNILSFGILLAGLVYVSCVRGVTGLSWIAPVTLSMLFDEGIGSKRGEDSGALFAEDLIEELQHSIPRAPVDRGIDDDRT